MPDSQLGGRAPDAALKVLRRCRNNEAARRSRLRRSQELKTLQQQVEEHKNDNATLRLTLLGAQQALEQLTARAQALSQQVDATTADNVRLQKHVLSTHKVDDNVCQTPPAVNLLSGQEMFNGVGPVMNIDLVLARTLSITPSVEVPHPHPHQQCRGDMRHDIILPQEQPVRLPVDEDFQLPAQQQPQLKAQLANIANCGAFLGERLGSHSSNVVSGSELVSMRYGQATPSTINQAQAQFAALTLQQAVAGLSFSPPASPKPSAAPQQSSSTFWSKPFDATDDLVQPMLPAPMKMVSETSSALSAQCSQHMLGRTSIAVSQDAGAALHSYSQPLGVITTDVASSFFKSCGPVASLRQAMDLDDAWTDAYVAEEWADVAPALLPVPPAMAVEPAVPFLPQSAPPPRAPVRSASAMRAEQHRRHEYNAQFSATSDCSSLVAVDGASAGTEFDPMMGFFDLQTPARSSQSSEHTLLLQSAAARGRSGALLML